MIQTPDSSEQERVEPLTEDQLALVSTWIKRAAKTAADRVIRRAVLGFMILLVGIGVSLYVNNHDAANARKATVNSGRAVAVDGCNRDFRDKDDFRGLLLRLKVANDSSFRTNKVAFKAGKITPQAYASLVRGHDAAVKFYTDSLNDQKYPNCGKARSIVTDDPSKTVVVPYPLSIKDAKNADIAAASERIQKGG